MKISFSKLNQLPVLTQSKVYLGKVVDLEIDTESQKIQKLIVEKKSFLIKEHTLLISFKQVISITNKEIIVLDNILTELNTNNSLLNQLPKKINETVTVQSEINNEL